LYGISSSNNSGRLHRRKSAKVIAESQRLRIKTGVFELSEMDSNPGIDPGVGGG
jgi:hypothetical protein